MNIKAIILLSKVISLSYVSPIFSQINRDLSPSMDSLLAWANDAYLPLPQQFHYAPKAYNIAVENRDTAITFKALMQMYRKKKKLREYGESFIYLQNAYKARTYCKDVVLFYINLASRYFLENKHQKMHYFVDSAKIIPDTMKQLDKHEMAELFCLRGRLALVEGKEQEAILWFQKCVDLKQDCERKARAYLTECYERNGDFAKSAACYREIVRLDSTKLATFESEAIKNNASTYQLSEEKRRNETLKNEQIRLYLCIPIGFLIVLIFYQRYKNAKTRKTLLEYKLEISEKNGKLQALEQAKLEQTIATQQEDLKNRSIDIVQKNEFLADLEREIQSLNAAVDKDNIQELEVIIRRNALNNEQNIVEFKGQVEALNSIFYDRLRKRASDLSPTELEICGLIRLNLSSKEIAAIRNIEPKSVDMSRYRLRQKLNLKQGEDLTTVLKSI